MSIMLLRGPKPKEGNTHLESKGHDPSQRWPIWVSLAPNHVRWSAHKAPRGTLMKEWVEGVLGLWKGSFLSLGADTVFTHRGTPLLLWTQSTWLTPHPSSDPFLWPQWRARDGSGAKRHDRQEGEKACSSELPVKNYKLLWRSWGSRINKESHSVSLFPDKGNTIWGRFKKSKPYQHTVFRYDQISTDKVSFY